MTRSLPLFASYENEIQKLRAEAEKLRAEADRARRDADDALRRARLAERTVASVLPELRRAWETASLATDVLGWVSDREAIRQALVDLDLREAAS